VRFACSAWILGAGGGHAAVDCAGITTAGIIKDVLMVGGYQEAEVSSVADNPGLTLFHCHQQLHMDFGFMTLLDYV